MASVYNSQLDAFELYHKIQEQERAGQSGSAIGLPALGHALAGSAGTAISHIVLYPLDLVITRLQVQKQLKGPGETASAAQYADDAEYRSLQDAVEKIYKHEGGLSAFWNGWKEDTTKSIIDSFLFFLAYSALRQRQQNRLGTKSLPVINELGVGIVAGAISKFVTTPMQQIVTRKQTAAMVSARDPTATIPMDRTGSLSVKDIALQIRSEKGLSGFWAGYSASLILTLNPAITFLLQNLIRRILLARKRRAGLLGKEAEVIGPKTLFLVAAISKAIASTITYPFSLAKSRAQVSSPPTAASHQPSGLPILEAENTKQPEHTSNATKENPTSSKNTPRMNKASAQNLLVLIKRNVTDMAVIRSLITIHKTEGLAGLYSGLSADVAKGFLGHGLSMALKDRIHVLIISAYFALLSVTERIPSSAADVSASVADASGGVRAEIDSITEQAGREFARVRASAGDVMGSVGEGVSGFGGRVGEGVTGFSDGVRGVGESVAQGVRNGVKNAVGGGGEKE
ncbi:hypothetical protein AAFC00_000193 [Neodothiora populina]|uniref:Peroxisomal adenine nucleotide transporter 1 n=1 Tax=Neodothiora populina TaxID=2781224 RepID=A0ABR3P2I0_9PEZI